MLTLSRQLVSMVVEGQLQAVRKDVVRDILGSQELARVPLAPAEIAGVLNLRGRIVTAIDLRRRLGMACRSDHGAASSMHVMVDHQGELYSLLVDRVGEVLTLSDDRFEAEGGNLPPRWRPLAHGIFRLDEALLVELDIAGVLALQPAG